MSDTHKRFSRFGRLAASLSAGLALAVGLAIAPAAAQVAQWNYDVNPATGNGRATYPGEIVTGLGCTGCSGVSLPPGTYAIPNITVNAGGTVSSIASGAFAGYEAMMGAGSFIVWQEGTTFTNPASGSHAATLWDITYDGTPGTFTVSQNGGPLAVGAPNNLEWKSTVAGTGGTFKKLMYPIEDASVYNTQTCTFSFLAYAASGSPNLTAKVIQHFGTGGSPSADVVASTQTYPLTNGWTLYTATFAMPSTAAKTFGSNFNDYVAIEFDLPLNSTFDIVLSEVRLQNTPVATPFNPIPYSVVLGNIQRFYQQGVLSMGGVATAAAQQFYAPIPFKSVMRGITPNITFSLLSGGSVGNITTSLPNFNYSSPMGAAAWIQSTAAGVTFAQGIQFIVDARL